jgi:hypothetical protein
MIRCSHLTGEMLRIMIPEPGHRIPETGKLLIASNAMRSPQLIQI